MLIPGYKIIEEIYRGPSKTLLRAVRVVDEVPVVIKMPSIFNDNFPLQEFENEFQLLRKYDLTGALKAYRKYRLEHNFILELEDFNGIDLQSYLSNSTITFLQRLHIAVNLLSVIEELHMNRILHRDIRPLNFLVNPDTLEIKCFDLSFSVFIDEPEGKAYPTKKFDAALEYLSPEQTGRISLKEDLRSDLYSAGITLYKLFTNQIPFENGDLNELIHAHIAKQPMAPVELNPQLPKVVSEIILKLLEKKPEARYQSAKGLKLDLKECLYQYSSFNKIQPFVPDQLHRKEDFKIPSILYGRENEIESILRSFKRAKNKNEVVFIYGKSGIGKSSLVKEVQKRLAGEKVIFISGKFDQYLQKVPFGGVTKAFRELILKVSKGDEIVRQKWKEAILHAVGDLGQLIIDEIPEVEMIIGKQPEVEKVLSVDAQNRKIVVFSKFIDALIVEHQSLIIFLDDLQWADPSSLKFIQLVASRESANILIIGSYRDNEIFNQHGLLTTIEELRNTVIHVNEIGLLPLTSGHINALLSDTLSCPAKETTPLADIFFTKTLGNPLFINELLNSLYNDGLIFFDSVTEKWSWELEKTAAYTDSESSIDLITRKIQRLSASAQEALSYAACIGGAFDLDILSSLIDKTKHETAEDLKEAVSESLIVVSRNEQIHVSTHFYKKTKYCFSHDLVQQAAYALIPDASKEELHLSIGYILLDQGSYSEIEKNIFEIVSHLNYGKSLIKEKEDIIKFANLNLIAGKKAKFSTAFEVAFGYFMAGLNYLTEGIRNNGLDHDSGNIISVSEDNWANYYQLTLSLYMQAAETAYLINQFETTTSLVGTVLQHVKTLKEKTDANLIQIQAFIYEKKNDKVIEYALQLLKTLGISFPAKCNNYHIISSFLKCKWMLRGKKPQDIEKLPEMKNQEILEAFRIIQYITATTYLTLPKLYPLLVLKMVQLSVKHGNAPQSPLAYVTYGAILNAIQTDNKACFLYGQLAVNLLDKSENKVVKERSLLIFNLINRLAKEHIHHSLEPLKRSFTTGVESGEIEYAVYASNSYCLLLLLSGKNLNWVKEEMINCSKLPIELGRETTSTGNEALIQIVSNYVGENRNAKTLNGDYFNDREGFKEVFQTNQKSKIFTCHLFKTILCIQLEDYKAAEQNALHASSYLEFVQGMVLEPLFYFYNSLLNFALYYADKNRNNLAQALSNKKKLKKWAIQVPINYLHKYYLLEAEDFRISKNEKLAVEFYDKAIKLSKENNYCPDAALSNELAGKYWLERGQPREASVYLNSAFEVYIKWGCKLKVDHLTKQYGELLSAVSNPYETIGQYENMTKNGNITSAFDLATLMKASTAISSEVVFDKLLEKLMKVVIENAGAQVGYFILERSGQLFIEAKQSIENEKVLLLKIPLLKSGLVPETIIKYVFETKENVIINNAEQDEHFKRELTSLDKRIKSILCIPTINQGKLIGVLYLENNLTTDAFTRDRVEILKLLSGQIAVSIENAILYEDLEQKVIERTAKIQVQKEEIERQKQLVEEKSRYKEQFFANMSHEIRTPMTAIIGMSELIFDTPLEPKQLEYAKVIKYSSENLLAIINDILDYSKIEAGKFSFVRKPFQIRDRITRLGYILKSLAEEKGVELRISIDDSIGEQLIGDPLRLHQILLNLGSNAIKFTNKGYVEIAVEKITGNEKSEALCFHVKDTGMGIPEDKLQFIFETFSRIEDEVNIQHTGTGLGLFIAKKLVEEQGGSMQVKSKLGIGTEFQFNLSFETSSIYLVQKKEHAEMTLRGTKILLVEDTLFNQIIAEELLKKMIPEVVVTIAENGAVALEKLEVLDFDIVLMDVKMPVMDGYKASRIIRGGEKNNQIPILAFTANASPLEVEKCKEAGMDDYISKPIESGKLKEKIWKLVEEKKASAHIL